MMILRAAMGVSVSVTASSHGDRAGSSGIITAARGIAASLGKSIAAPRSRGTLRLIL
ncbi:hypothetical protein [Marivita hallyeonensis]|uniref:hypothetical protein n=1 Tax=Marivita hallyeonensis TaxID=996342 RepID=UPI0015B42083|nr:hypothetical protein [Marivita hallyeonensis]